MVPPTILGLAAVGILWFPVLPAAAESATIDEPDLDRWMYVWNSTPGARAQASTFSALPDDSGDDDRLGQFLIGFNTAARVPSGLPPSRYVLASVRVTATIGLDNLFVHDPTPDPWQSFGTPSGPAIAADTDPGRPVELFGAGFRNGWTAATFLETSPFGPFPGGRGTRNAFALGFDAHGTARDVGSNVTGGFDPLPWAAGQADLAPGSPVPGETIYTFDVDLTLPGVDAWIRRGLSEGRLRFFITSLHPALQQGGEFVSWITRDDALHQLFGGYAPTLEIRYTIPSLAITRRMDGPIQLDWQETAGLTYQLQASPTPAFTNWSVILTHTPATDGPATRLESITTDKQFYRLAVWRP